MTDKCCENCLWYDIYLGADAQGVCANEQSKYYGSWQDYDFACKKWEAEDG